MNEHTENQGAGAGSPQELLEMILKRAKQHGRASLLPLKAQDRPLREIVAGTLSASGEIARFDDDGRPAPLRFAVERIGADPPTFRLNVADWPKGCTPLAVFLGQFEYWQFEPGKVRFSYDERDLPRPRRKAAEPSTGEDAKELEAFQFGADTKDAEADEPVFVTLDGRTACPESAPRSAARASAQVACNYLLDKGALEITAALPEGSDGETVVAELRTGAGPEARTLRRAVHLDCRLPDGRYKANTFGFFPASRQGEVELVVRPLTGDDLGLLDPRAVQAFLARQDYVSMPAERTDQGFVFSARWADQQQEAAEASTTWALSVAMEEEG